MPGSPLDPALAQTASRRVRIMPDWGCDGLWEIVSEGGDWLISPLVLKELALPSELADEFEVWLQCFYQEYVEQENERAWDEKYDRSEFVARFNLQGRELARRLKQHLGETCYLEYVAEACDGAGEVEAIT